MRHLARAAAAAALLALLAPRAHLLAAAEDAEAAVAADGSASASDVAADGASGAGAGFGLPEPVLPAGFALEFPAPAAPRSLAVAPAWRALLVVDGAVHVRARAGAAGLAARALAPLGLAWLLDVLLGAAPRPVPYAYLVRPHAQARPAGGDGAPSAPAAMRPELVRRLEFPERRGLPYGVAEAADARLGVGFYSVPGVELWSGAQLEAKLTLHEHSIKPALPVFDSAGNLWVPFTIADRLDEEGENIIALWAYDAAGARWEVFARRQFERVRFPHSVHLDREGRVFVAGVAGKWPWVDGQYGPELKPGVGAADALVRIDVYSLASAGDLAGAGAAGAGAAARRAQAFEREQRFRFCETHGSECTEGAPQASVPEAAWRAEHVRAALAPLRSFAFPAPFLACLWPLFVLTGDGHAVCSCAESDTLQVLRLAAPRGKAGGGGGGEGEEEEEAPGAGANAHGLREAWGPPEPAGGLALLQEGEAAVVRTIVRPFGIASIGGLSMDPSGRAFAILDKGGRRIVGAPWPWPSDPHCCDAPAHVAAVELLPFDE
jgi:hypothetical protein